VANLFSEDFLGEKSIKILMSDNAEFYEIGDTLITELEKDMLAGMADQFVPITEKLEALVPKFDSILASVNSLLNDEFREDVQGTLHNIEDLTGNLASEFNNENSKVNNILTNVESLTASLASQDQRFDTITGNLVSLTEQLKKAELEALITDASSALTELDKVLNAVNNGDGPVNAALNDPHFKDELVGITENINKLLEDVKMNPQRYVHFSLFGRKDKSQDK
jgi:phospholipid/cholesterol/gamma-HCH transport system substrate-binding protein